MIALPRRRPPGNDDGPSRWPRGDGGALGRGGRAGTCRRGRGAVRASGWPGWQPAGEHPGADRRPPQPSRLAPRGRRGHGRVRIAGAGRAWRGRAASGLRRPVQPGHSRLAPRPARGRRARLRAQHRRMGRHAHHHDLGPPHTWPGPARPGPPGRGRPGLPAGPGDHRAAGPAAPACCWPGVCRSGRGGLSAQRARGRAAARDRWHRVVPAAGLYPAAGRGLGDAGVDPAGYRRPGGGAGGDRRGCAGRAGAAGSPRPGPGAAGAAAAWPRAT